MALNLVGSFSAFAHCYNVMKNNKHVDGERGVMIAISSCCATHANNQGLVPYAATKGALNSMMLPMAREMGP